MKRILPALAIACVVCVGCNRESPKGGPGAGPATTPDKSPSGKPGETSRDQFALKVPAGGTNVTQGKREEVTIALNRDGDFKQAVKFTFKAPEGLKVVPADATIKGDESKTNVFVEAAETATVGRHSITVTGTPDTGKPATVMMDIDVKKK